MSVKKHIYTIHEWYGIFHQLTKSWKYAEFQPAFPYNNTSNGVRLLNHHRHSPRNKSWTAIKIKAGKWNLFRLKERTCTTLKKRSVSNKRRKHHQKSDQKLNFKLTDKNETTMTNKKTSSADLPILLQGPRKIMANYLLLLMFQKSQTTT